MDSDIHEHSASRRLRANKWAAEHPNWSRWCISDGTSPGIPGQLATACLDCPESVVLCYHVGPHPLSRPAPSSSLESLTFFIIHIYHPYYFLFIFQLPLRTKKEFEAQQEILQWSNLQLYSLLPPSCSPPSAALRPIWKSRVPPHQFGGVCIIFLWPQNKGLLKQRTNADWPFSYSCQIPQRNCMDVQRHDYRSVYNIVCPPCPP